MARRQSGVQPATRTLEQGEIFFFYELDATEASEGESSQVQSFHLVLRPDERAVCRFLSITQKHLPDAADPDHRHLWGRVEKLAAELPGKEAEAQFAGEGRYRILSLGPVTELVYALELPQWAGEIQEEFNIQCEAAFRLSVRNPLRRRFSEPGNLEPPVYPMDLQKSFRNRRFAKADPTALLDFAGAEFVLAASGEDSAALAHAYGNGAPAPAEVFSDLHLDSAGHSLKSAVNGAKSTERKAETRN